jgi:hypothetical protein
VTYTTGDRDALPQCGISEFTAADVSMSWWGDRATPGRPAAQKAGPIFAVVRSIGPAMVHKIA